MSTVATSFPNQHSLNSKKYRTWPRLKAVGVFRTILSISVTEKAFASCSHESHQNEQPPASHPSLASSTPLLFNTPSLLSITTWTSSKRS